MPDTTRKVEIEFSLLDDFSSSLRTLVTKLNAAEREARQSEQTIGERLPRAFRKFEAGIKRFLITPLSNLRTAFHNVIGTIFNVRTAIAGLVAGLAVRRVVAELAETVRELDEIHDASKKLGVSAEDLSAFRFAAEQAGVSVEKLAAGIRISQKGIAEFVRMAKGPAADALKQLGLTAKDLTDENGNIKDFADLLPLIADRLALVQDEAAKINIASDLFGKGGAEFLALLEGGGAALTRLRQEAEALGAVFTPRQTEAANDISDALARIRAAFTGLKAEIVTAVAPAVTEFFNNLAAGISTARALMLELAKDPQALRDALISAGATIVTIGARIGLAFGAAFVEGAIQSIKLLGSQIKDAVLQENVVFSFFDTTSKRALQQQLDDLKQLLLEHDAELARRRQAIAEGRRRPETLNEGLVRREDTERAMLEVTRRLEEIDRLETEATKKRQERLRDSAKAITTTFLSQFELTTGEMSESITDFVAGLGERLKNFVITTFTNIKSLISASGAQAAAEVRNIGVQLLGPFDEIQRMASELRAIAPLQLPQRRAALLGDDRDLRRSELRIKQARELEEVETKLSTVSQGTREEAIRQLNEIHTLEQNQLEGKIELERITMSVAKSEEAYATALRETESLLKQNAISESEAQRITADRAQALKEAAEAAKVAIAALRESSEGMGLDDELDQANRKMQELIERARQGQPVMESFWTGAVQGARNFVQAVGSSAQGVARMTQEVLGSIREGLSGTISALIKGTKDFEQIWLDVLDRIIDAVADFLADQVIRSFVGFFSGVFGGTIGGLGGGFGLFGGFARGGEVPSRASDVPRRGPTDTVPAWLTPGEWVIPREKVRSIMAVLKLAPELLGRWASSLGVAVPAGFIREIEAFREIHRSAGPAFAAGGIVSLPAAPVQAGGREQTIIPIPIVADQLTMDRLLAGGQGAMLRWMQENSATIARIVASGGFAR